ncbi:hypothetical protein [Streptacidiphilus anmyonensis]|uniref:hypothetical protein n=1 Tax=Streptacidiphilus anmyonensis TaxID=405782 RepID=UPI00128B1EC9|nr:hypothetical protein [Streptacidiphilus anmyonensis]
MIVAVACARYRKIAEGPDALIPIPTKPDLRTRWNGLSRPKKIATGAAAAVFVPSFLVGAGQGLGQALTGYKASPAVTVTATATERTTITVTAAPKPTATHAVPSTTAAKPAPARSTESAAADNSGALSGDGGATSPGYPVLLSPSGRYYHAGEFCPHADDGTTTVDSGGTPITCSDVNGYFRWHY